MKLSQTVCFPSHFSSLKGPRRPRVSDVTGHAAHDIAMRDDGISIVAFAGPLPALLRSLS